MELPKPAVEYEPLEGVEVQLLPLAAEEDVAWRRSRVVGRARVLVVRAASSRRDLANCILVGLCVGSVLSHK